MLPGSQIVLGTARQMTQEEYKARFGSSAFGLVLHHTPDMRAACICCPFLRTQNTKGATKEQRTEWNARACRPLLLANPGRALPGGSCGSSLDEGIW